MSCMTRGGCSSATAALELILTVWRKELWQVRARREIMPADTA